MKERSKTPRRLLALFLVLVLGLSFATPVASSAKSKATTVSMKKKVLPLYQMSSQYKSDEALYFNGKGDIPYLDLDEAFEMVKAVLLSANPDLDLTKEMKGNELTWTRKDGIIMYKTVFNFKKNTIYFSDVNGFFRAQGLALVGESRPAALAGIFQVGEETYSRYGKAITVKLNNYGISLLKDKKRQYIPLQTFNDLFYCRFGSLILYNGESVIISKGSLTDDLQKIHYSAKKKTMSKAYAAFNYGELCLALDHMYGLKDTHDIKDFDSFFIETGLAPLIKSQETLGTDMAMLMTINMYFDELHSAFLDYSYGTSLEEFKKTLDMVYFGSYRKRFIDTRNRLLTARKASNPDGIKAYDEKGDTAYITFDSFAFDPTQDHSSLPTDEDLPNLGNDTLRLMQYALKKITRENTPIKRVVLDLSLNGGGLGFAAACVLQTFLGNTSMTFKDALTGATSTINNKVDINLDTKFDENDTLANRKDLKLYCLTSGGSYSCGNMVPCSFKDSGTVALLGRTSGGGACNVQPMSTASGAVMQISGNYRISFSKNGEFYNVDRGADPDIYVDDMTRIYDRAYVNEILDGLK